MSLISKNVKGVFPFRIMTLRDTAFKKKHFTTLFA